MKQRYADFVKERIKPGADIRASLSVVDAHLLHMLLGLSGEVGELTDAIKKYVIYHKDLDTKNVIEELGDIEFYLEGFRQALFISREQCIVENIEKLSKRYPTTYKDSDAQARVDKGEGKHEL